MLGQAIAPVGQPVVVVVSVDQLAPTVKPAGKVKRTLPSVSPETLGSAQTKPLVGVLFAKRSNRTMVTFNVTAEALGKTTKTWAANIIRKRAKPAFQRV
jgi:hypothetical protein